jgi:AcrR family transcriptional regulator
MGERVPARDRLLKSAAELFYRDGVGATGIDTITAHAGVAKMSLYNNFASKSELVKAYLDARLEVLQQPKRREIGSLPSSIPMSTMRNSPMAGVFAAAGFSMPRPSFPSAMPAVRRSRCKRTRSSNFSGNI